MTVIWNDEVYDYEDGREDLVGDTDSDRMAEIITEGVRERMRALDAGEPLPDTWHADHGGWRSVDHAVTHAIIVQGGFTTASIEARRMLSEPQNRATAEEWLDEHEPGWRDE